MPVFAICGEVPAPNVKTLALEACVAPRIFDAVGFVPIATVAVIAEPSVTGLPAASSIVTWKAISLPAAYGEALGCEVTTSLFAEPATTVILLLGPVPRATVGDVAAIV